MYITLHLQLLTPYNPFIQHFSASFQCCPFALKETSLLHTASFSWNCNSSNEDEI